MAKRTAIWVRTKANSRGVKSGLRTRTTRPSLRMAAEEGGVDPDAQAQVGGGDLGVEEGEVDEEEGLEDQEHAAVAEEAAAGDKEEGDGEEGGLVEVEGDDQCHQPPGGDGDPGEGVGEGEATGEHAGGAEEIEGVVLGEEAAEEEGLGFNEAGLIGGVGSGSEMWG